MRVFLGCTHNIHTRKREKLCNMTKKSTALLLDYCRRHRRTASIPGRREPMGQRAARLA
nr:MAG TPA: aspartate racemase [Bacteriophage sp.]